MDFNTLHFNLEAIGVIFKEYVVSGGPLQHNTVNDFNNHISVQYAACWNAEYTDYLPESEGGDFATGTA